jgi:hypothetical protein
MKNIPAGYQIHCETWENDGDNYKTTSISGLTKEDAKFYVDISKEFGVESRYGNDDISVEDARSIVGRALKNNQMITSTTAKLWQERMSPEETSYDIIYLLRKKLLGNPSEGYDPSFCRAVEGVEVYYYPAEIVEVTEEFI